MLVTCPKCQSSLGDLDGVMVMLKNSGSNSAVDFKSSCCQFPLKAYRESMFYYIQAESEAPIMIGAD